MKIWKVAVLSTVVIALVLGLTLPGLAAPSEGAPQTECQPHPRLIKGEVDRIDDSSFQIQPGDRVIEVNDDTRFFRVSVPRGIAHQLRHRVSPMEGEGPGLVEPAAGEMPGKGVGLINGQGRTQTLARPEPLPGQRGLAANVAPAGEGAGQVRLGARLGDGSLGWLKRFGEEVTFADLAVGDRVVVWVVAGENGPLAKMVFIVTPAARDRVVGIIAEDGIDEVAKTITVNPVSETEGVESEIIFLYDGATLFVLRGTPSLKDGMKVMVIYVETDEGFLARKVLTRVELPEAVE